MGVLCASLAMAAALPGRAKFNILLAVVALSALMVATTSLTRDEPHVVEDGEEATGSEPVITERDIVLEELDSADSARVANHKLEMTEAEPLEMVQVETKDDFNRLLHMGQEHHRTIESASDKFAHAQHAAYDTLASNEVTDTGWLSIGHMAEQASAQEKANRRNKKQQMDRALGLNNDDEDDEDDEELLQSFEEDPLERLGASLAATQDGLDKEAKTRGLETAAESSGQQPGNTESQAPQPVQGTDQAKNSKDPAASPAVEKALKDAANAKIQAMALQQKALAAGAAAKAASAKAAQAPMTQAGQEVVRSAQKAIAKAKLDVDTAKAAMANLRRLKTEASKAILDAAGGKYRKSTGYAGTGGYFGAALRTAFNNGKLSERLKHQEWKDSKLKAIKREEYNRGLKEGEKKGFSKGEKAGMKKELPKAVAKAEKNAGQGKEGGKGTSRCKQTSSSFCRTQRSSQERSFQGARSGQKRSSKSCD